MGMQHPTNRWTVERVRALPDDGNRYELVDGELVVTPAPGGLHREAIQALVIRMEPWLRETRIGRLLFSPADISLGEDEILQPDNVRLSNRHRNASSGLERHRPITPRRGGAIADDGAIRSPAQAAPLSARTD